MKRRNFLRQLAVGAMALFRGEFVHRLLKRLLRRPPRPRRRNFPKLVRLSARFQASGFGLAAPTVQKPPAL